MRSEILEFWEKMDFSMDERKHFEKVIQHDIRQTEIDDLKSGGYVIEVLESSKLRRHDFINYKHRT